MVNQEKIYQITNLGKKKLQKEKERMLKQFLNYHNDYGIKLYLLDI